MKHYDYFVIGGGSGGVRSARIAATHGANVGLAEAGRLGGTCVNVGCIPKKLYSYAADYGHDLEDMVSYGWKNAKADFDWQGLVKNKDREIARLNGIYSNILDNSNVDVLNGHAKFIDKNTLDVNGVTITADKILIAAGGRPRAPHFPGAEYAIISDDIFDMKELPKRIVIQGGGYVAVEFAHIFQGLGVDVTVLYRGETWLREFDRDISAFLKNEYEKQNIKVQFKTDIEYVTNNHGFYQVHTTNGDQINCDCIFSAIGRTPNSDQLDLENAEIILLPNGQIEVTDNWETSTPHIYAVGDISNDWNLTPYAIAEGHILADRLFGKEQTRHDNLNLVATAIFSNPTIGTVGLSEEKAIEKGYSTKVFKTDFKALRHTLTGRDERTFMKLVIDTKTDIILGCHIVGKGADEMIQGIAIAMNMGAKKADFDRTIGVHPTSAEELVTLS